MTRPRFTTLAFWSNYRTTIGKALLVLLIGIHTMRAVAFFSRPTRVEDGIAAAGLAIAYLFALVVFRRGWTGWMAASMMTAGLASAAQLVFPSVNAMIGAVAAEVSLCICIAANFRLFAEAMCGMAARLPAEQ